MATHHVSMFFGLRRQAAFDRSAEVAGAWPPELADLAPASQLATDFVDYASVIAFKQSLLGKAAQDFFINAN